MNQRFASEDEHNLMTDIERVQGWYEEAKGDAEELKEAADALLEEETGEPSQENQSAWDEADGAYRAMADEAKDLKDDIDGLQERLQEKRNEQQRNEEQRREAAEQRDIQRGLEAQDRAAQ